ncbi:DNA polymerase, palm domain [Cinara cedri]|uniref:DNA polymerase, palm domain n=1 Tax=Cinara cedri TaxID=506608 RepID=A0A5E4NQ38_9HEMI|nr:DNA polymerase, palm domain [Cinara cedri]
MAPGMAFDCALKITKGELELLSDYDKVLMMEAGIRGLLIQAVKRYSKANSSKVPDYDPSKPESTIAYLDAMNLHGWAMMQYLPKNGFELYDKDLSTENILRLLDGMDDTSPVGLISENDTTGSKINKLVANLMEKTKYVVHYRILKQALSAGLVLIKVHRILKFNQSPWLEKYIELNTTMRRNAENDFEKDFFKLMNNAVFGKTMENVRNCMQMKLISDEKQCLK